MEGGGGLGFTNPRKQAESEYAVSVKIIASLVTQKVLQAHEPLDNTVVRTFHQIVHKEKDEALQEWRENVRNSFSSKTRKAADLAMKKGVSSWLTVIPLKDMVYTLNKREFRDSVSLRYDWQNQRYPFGLFLWG